MSEKPLPVVDGVTIFGPREARALGRPIPVGSYFVFAYPPSMNMGGGHWRIWLYEVTGVIDTVPDLATGVDKASTLKPIEMWKKHTAGSVYLFGQNRFIAPEEIYPYLSDEDMFIIKAIEANLIPAGIIVRYYGINEAYPIQENQHV